MTRHSIGRFVIAVVLAAVLLPAVVQAQAIVKVNDDVWFRFGMQLQGWADWTQSAVTNGYAQNLYLRRDRFQVLGQLAPNVSFFFQTDDPNLGKAPKTSLTSGFVIQDAWMEWKLADELAIGGGKFIVPLSRNELTSTVSFLTLDISPVSSLFSAPTQSDATRDSGFYAKGYLGGGHLEYRAAVEQGVRVADSRNPFRFTGWLNLDLFDTEKGYVYAGTNLGTKKILALSGGYDGQKSYKAYSGDVFTTLPLGSGGEFAAQGQWVHYDGGDFIPTLKRQDTYLVELAILIPATHFQPFGKWEDQKFNASTEKKNDIDRWGAGAHYYVYKQNLKFSAQWLRIEPKSPIKKTNEFTLAMQAFYN